MFMQYAPLLETKERALFFKDQIVGDGKDLFVGIAEAAFQVSDNTQFLSYGIKEVGRAVKPA